MTAWLKQSTATNVEIGGFVDDTDGKTPETALTIAQADVQLIKNGGAAAQKNDATSATHRFGGHYTVPLNATDTGTLGRLRVIVNESGALPVWRDFLVVPANIYDSLIGGTANLQAHATQTVEGTLDVTETLRLMLAALVGKLSGAATTTVAIRDTADTKNRISATVDADGNRSAVTLDAS